MTSRNHGCKISGRLLAVVARRVHMKLPNFTRPLYGAREHNTELSFSKRSFSIQLQKVTRKVRQRSTNSIEMRKNIHGILRVLKKSNNCRFDSYSFKKQCIDYYYIQYYLSGLSLVHFQDDLSRNGCTLLLTWIIVTIALQNIKANSCSDDNSQCVHWANGNECCKNPAYMLENCCSACKAKGKRVIFIIGSSFCKHYLDGGGGWLKSAKLEDSF